MSNLWTSKVIAVIFCLIFKIMSHFFLISRFVVVFILFSWLVMLFLLLLPLLLMLGCWFFFSLLIITCYDVVGPFSHYTICAHIYMAVNRPFVHSFVRFTFFILFHLYLLLLFFLLLCCCWFLCVVRVLTTLHAPSLVEFFWGSLFIHLILWTHSVYKDCYFISFCFFLWIFIGK